MVTDIYLSLSLSIRKNKIKKNPHPHAVTAPQMLICSLRNSGPGASVDCAFFSTPLLSFWNSLAIKKKNKHLRLL